MSDLLGHTKLPREKLQTTSDTSGERPPRECPLPFLTTASPDTHPPRRDQRRPQTSKSQKKKNQKQKPVSCLHSVKQGNGGCGAETAARKKVREQEIRLMESGQ